MKSQQKDKSTNSLPELGFMREHNISKRSELEEKVLEVSNRCRSIREQLRVYGVQQNIDSLIHDLQQPPQRDMRVREIER